MTVTGPANVRSPRTVVRIGNPWVAIPYVVVMTPVVLFLGGLCLSAILSGKPDDPGLRAGVLLACVPCLLMTVFCIGLLAVTLVRQPRVLTRSLVLSPNEVVMPSMRRSHVPVSEVAGVGLVLQQAGRGGMWMLTVWTVDGGQTMAGSFNRKSEILHPEGTRIAQAAERVYRHVLDHQGPDGPLATLARQRTIRFSRYSPFKQVWDPSNPPRS